MKNYGYDPVAEMNPAKILLVRFLLEGAKSSGTGKFLYLPGGALGRSLLPSV